MVSPKIYEEFSLPYLSEQVKEIQRLKKKAIAFILAALQTGLKLLHQQVLT